MWLRVLGSAAGGGFPQWNCGCRNCRGVRQGTIQARARTQASVALSADGHHWFLLHASPDIRVQIESFPPLHPRSHRHTPIAGILLTNGDLDQCLGLLSLRESQPLRVYATERVRSGVVDRNVWFETLERTPDQVIWKDLKLGSSESTLELPDGTPSGLRVTSIPVPGKVPLHLQRHRPPDEEDAVALLIREVATGGTLFFAPCVGGPTSDLRTRLESADCVFFDGTFWTDDELTKLGVGPSARHMAHWPLSGSGGSLPMLASLQTTRCILIHLNNTNPLLDEQSPERRHLEQVGVEVAYDGMDLVI